MSFAYPIHNDEPGFDGKDFFSQKKLVEAIAHTLARRANPPFVASLNGDWGQGKTSLLREVHRKLAGRFPEDFEEPTKKREFPNVCVVWFEAWRYQHDPTPIVALLNEIRRQFELFSRFGKFKKAAGKAAYVAVEAALHSLGDLGGLIGPFSSAGKVAGNIQKSGEAWEKRQHAYTLPSQTLRHLLNKAIQDFLDTLLPDPTTPEHSKRLVVIVDDLDRCQPSVAYKLLEGIKVFLNLPSCSFLLGNNRTEILRSIAAGLAIEGGDALSENELSADGTKQALPLRHIAREYYEKLCSFSWDIPFPTTRETASYVSSLLAVKGTCLSLNMISRLRKLLSEAPVPLLPANPRRLKAFGNSLLHLGYLGPLDTDAAPVEDAELLLLLSYIATFHPEIFRWLLVNPKVFSDLKQHAQTENGQLDQGASNVLDGAPWIGIEFKEKRIKYADPGTHGIFRMTPILVTMTAPTDDQLKRYLPHAAR